MAPTFWKVGGFPTAGGAAGGRSRVTAALARAPRNRHAQRARSHPTRLHRERLDSLPRSPSCSFACCVRRFAATSARGADEPHRHRRAPPDDRAPRRSLRRLLPPRSCRLTRAAAWTLVIFSTHTRARRVSRAARVLAVLGRALALAACLLARLPRHRLALRCRCPLSRAARQRSFAQPAAGPAAAWQRGAAANAVTPGMACSARLPFARGRGPSARCTSCVCARTTRRGPARARVEWRVEWSGRSYDVKISFAYIKISHIRDRASSAGRGSRR